MKPEKPITFKRLVVLLNPKSSNAAVAEKHVAALQKAYPGKVIVETFSTGGEANRALLQKHLRPGDILIPCGGDGTHSTVVDDLMHPSMPTSLRRTPVLPLGTGRMNDLAHMLNGRYFSDPEYVLGHGHELKVYPLVCTITPLDRPDQQQQHLAVYELGFGYSSEISKKANDPELRAKLQKQTPLARGITFFATGAQILKDTGYFDITYKGKRQTVLDVTAANGHIFAGFWRLPAKLSRRDFFFAISSEKGFIHTVRTIAELLTNTYDKGEIVTDLNFTLHQPTLAHFGGETFMAPAPCNVHITHHKEPVIMLATSPKA